MIQYFYISISMIQWMNTTSLALYRSPLFFGTWVTQLAYGYLSSCGNATPPSWWIEPGNSAPAAAVCIDGIVAKPALGVACEGSDYRQRSFDARSALLQPAEARSHGMHLARRPRRTRSCAENSTRYRAARFGPAGGSRSGSMPACSGAQRCTGSVPVGPSGRRGQGCGASRRGRQLYCEAFWNARAHGVARIAGVSMTTFAGRKGA